MSTMQEIERAIGDLTANQLQELYRWMEEHHPEPVETSLKVDLEAGKFDDRIQQALDEHRAGATRTL